MFWQIFQKLWHKNYVYSYIERYCWDLSTTESPIFNTRKLFSAFSYFSGEFWGASADTADIYIQILMMQFYSLPSHISLCKTSRIFESKYRFQRTNSTVRSNRSLKGWFCLLYFLLISLLNYVCLNFNFLDKYLKLRAIENLKN